MLDYSKRSRSGKFRLVTKFKKEKNNKNKETHSSMGLPGTQSAHSLSVSVTLVWSQPYQFSVSSHVLSLFCFTCILSAFSLSRMSFSHGKVVYCSVWVTIPQYSAGFPEQKQEVPSEEFCLRLAIFRGILEGA